jgi:hypothetical protein
MCIFTNFFPCVSEGWTLKKIVSKREGNRSNIKLIKVSKNKLFRTDPEKNIIPKTDLIVQNCLDFDNPFKTFVRRKRSLDGCLVFSSLVLEPQDNFEVRIDAADPLYCGSLKIGLTTFSLSGKEKHKLIQIAVRIRTETM